MTNKDGASKQDLPAGVMQALLSVTAAGAALSNCAFNLAQRKGEVIEQRTAETLDHCRKEWDAAHVSLHAALKATPASPAVESPESRMLLAACADLGSINEALGLDPDDGGAEPILEAIRELQALAAPVRTVEQQPAFYLSSQQLPLLGTEKAKYYFTYRMQAEGNFDTPVYLAIPTQATQGGAEPAHTYANPEEQERYEAIFANEAAAVEPAQAAPAAVVPELVTWVVERWHAEVANRPMVNVHRRALDDTWRQVLRHLGVNDRERLGPTHDELRALMTDKEWNAMNGTSSQAAVVPEAVERDDGMCRSCVNDKCTTGPECVTLGRDAAPEKVLLEHSGCGSNTQVDQLTVRLNPGDVVVLRKGPITAAIDRLAAKPTGKEQSS